MKKTLLIIIGMAILAAPLVCVGGMGNMPGMNMGGMQQTNSSPQTYKARGIVEKIAPDLHHATIHHEDIPGYMSGMTMNFPVHNTNELTGISQGDQVTFKLIVSQNDEWIEDIKPTGQKAPAMKNSMPSVDMSGTNK